MAEADLNDVGVITPTDQEPPATAPSLGMTAQWADDVHHALHARLTGEDQGYYGDFAEPGAWAKAYGGAFLHNGTWSTFRGRVWGAPCPRAPTPGASSSSIPTTTRSATAPLATARPPH